VDASPAMIELARDYEPGAKFDVVRLPTGLRPGDNGALPQADAVVSTGHVLNYLDTRAQIAQALSELARAVRPGGLLAIDLTTEAFCDRPGLGPIHAKVQDDWLIVTRFSRFSRSGQTRSLLGIRPRRKSCNTLFPHKKNHILAGCSEQVACARGLITAIPHTKGQNRESLRFYKRLAVIFAVPDATIRVNSRLSVPICAYLRLFAQPGSLLLALTIHSARRSGR
jgi:SAM-dependent methyltransferase